jgi:molecular chaperone HscB
VRPLSFHPAVISQRNHFELFDLPRRFALDLQALEQAYRRVQAQVHPDRFAAAGAAERRVALQWATHANEAWQTLRQPTRRAAYLCELAGAPVAAHSNTAMPADFLMTQMNWREALAEARAENDFAALQALAQQVTGAREGTLAAVADALDTRGDAAHAATLVRELLFIDKFDDELSLAIDEASDAAAASAEPPPRN